MFDCGYVVYVSVIPGLEICTVQRPRVTVPLRKLKISFQISLIYIGSVPSCLRNFFKTLIYIIDKWVCIWGMLYTYGLTPGLEIRRVQRPRVTVPLGKSKFLFHVS